MASRSARCPSPSCFRGCAKRSSASSRNGTPSIARGASFLRFSPLVIVTALQALENFRRPLEVDEALTLWLAGMPVHQALQWLAANDFQPPLVFLAFHPLAALGAPDWTYRLIALGFALGSLALVYQIVRLWGGSRAAWFAAIVAGLAPALILYNSWLRIYPFFDFEALLSFWLLTMVLTNDSLSAPARRGLWAGWTACAAAMFYTMYLGFVVIAAQLIYAAVVRRDALVKAMAGLGAAVVVWLPQFGTFVHQLNQGGTAFATFRQHEPAVIAVLAGSALFGQLGLSPAEYLIGAVTWFWLIAAVVITLAGDRRSLLPWLAAPSALLIGYSLAAGKLLFADRYHLLLAYAFAALTGVALDRLMAARRVAAQAVGAALGVSLLATACWTVFSPARSTAPWPQIAAQLKSNALPGDLIVLDQGNSYWALDRYGALAGHSVLPLLVHEGVGGAAKITDRFPRVWYVRFESTAIDPADEIARHLASGWRARQIWRFHDSMALEHVDVVLFVR